MPAEWSYDIIAPLYDDDMGQSMPFDDLNGYLHLLPGTPAKLLEIGCGTGRLTLELAGHGYYVTAIDRSAPMLERLRNKLRPDGRIDLKLMDARNIKLAGPFDAIFFAYSGFQYLLNDPDLSRFCDHVKRLLAPSGSLILDIFVHRKGSETADFVLDYERKLNDGRVLRRWKQVNVEDGINCVERRYVMTGRGKQQECRTKSFQRLYTPESLVEELKSRGFKLETGIFDYQAHTSSTNINPRFFTARFKLG